MRDTVKHGGFNRCIMKHILQNNILTDTQFMVKFPIAHEIATQATVAAQTVNMGIILRGMNVGGIYSLCTAYLRILWHFQTIGHMAGETYIEDGRPDATVFNNVNHVTYQRTSLPAKSTTRFKNNFQPGIPLMDALQ